MKESELVALVKLLDDPDETVSEIVEQKLIDLGTTVIGKLETAWEESFDVHIQQRLESIIHKIQLSTVEQDLTSWLDGGADDLLSGVLIVNRYQYPDLKRKTVEAQLEEIKTEIWRGMPWEMSALEKINTFNYVFYQQFRFGGNTSNFKDPQNSYLNLVLESKKGNQIMLAVVYSLIAQMLDLPVYGVNLPQHFILAYSGAEGPVSRSKIPTREPVLFYINVFNKGLVFGTKEIDFFLKQLNLNQNPEFYKPCSNDAIVLRILRNLISSYEELGSAEKVNELNELVRLVETRSRASKTNQND